ncbi:MAG: hypothetical protein K2J25_04915 [Oscillospiraceae bacterium]|nr:hypothetical protein [Oscillospiraceae bacterium]
MKKKKKLVAILSATTMTLASLTVASFSASAATNARIPYMLGDANNDYYVDAIDATAVMSALHSHGLQRGMAVSVSYVQANLSDWLPNAACAVAADVNKDNYISYEDADKMMEYYAAASTGGGSETDIGKMFLYIG